MKRPRSIYLLMGFAAAVAVLMSISMVNAAGDKTTDAVQEHALALDSLQQYAATCDLATGVTVPDFDCDAGTEVPISHFAGGNCDRPNRLNQECDPGSHFQVLTNTPDAVVVAHCRKRGLPAGQYADIAVIQYNRNNGATCFYQALGVDLPGQVKAPSQGLPAWRWETPLSTASIQCARCHDNGQLIRSPYITQNMGSNTMPGAGDFSFNSNQPYSFVGAEFASWRAYKVEVAGNTCNGCHRMGTNNLSQGGGTAVDFGIRATAPSEAHKNPHSPDSPIWMTPGQITFSPANAAAANAIRNCALRKNENPLPNAPDCKIEQFAGAFDFRADLSLEQTVSAASVIAGTNLTYVLKVTNNGLVAKAGATLIDTLPAGVTFVSATPSQGGCTPTGGIVTCDLGDLVSQLGSSAGAVPATVTIVVTVNSSTAHGTVLENTAVVSSSNVPNDSNLANNQAKVGTTVITSADVTIAKSATSDPAAAGADQTYNLTITNNAPSDAQDVMLNDATPTSTSFVSFAQNAGPAFTCTTPPSGGSGNVSCSLTSLAAGASASFSFVVHVSPSAPNGSMLSNTASVSSSTSDPNFANNAATITTGVLANADLSITKSQNSNLVIADRNQTYQLTFTNNGSADAQDAALNDTIPANTTFDSFKQDTGPAFSCTTPPKRGTGNVSCTLATLPAGAAATFTLVVRVAPVDVSSIANTASVSSGTTDPNPGNNAATVTADVSVKNHKQSVLADLTALRQTVTDKQDGNKLDDIIKHVSNSLDPSRWAGGNTLVAKGGDNVFSKEKAAVDQLSSLIKKNDSDIDGALQRFINRLVAADRALADIAIGQARSAGGDPKQIAQARDNLAQGNESVDDDQYSLAIRYYRSAWRHAQQALKK
jgi:uncharacterized repeat protein (TIGR01451 family)